MEARVDTGPAKAAAQTGTPGPRVVAAVQKALQSFCRQSDTHGRGVVGEDAAVVWLAGRGYRIVARNARNDAGEIDTIAWDDDTLCFIEVKARANDVCGLAIEAVGVRKQRRIVRAAALFLADVAGDVACRFDVLGMDLTADGWRFTLIRDAFGADGCL